ncbi:hypothetical protein BT96DRAFT_199794, partial [Gymnopus androsaceus JB14]
GTSRSSSLVHVTHCVSVASKELGRSRKPKNACSIRDMDAREPKEVEDTRLLRE